MQLSWPKGETAIGSFFFFGRRTGSSCDLQERLNDKKEALLEKELILEEAPTYPRHRAFFEHLMEF